jgi:glycine C-acetyltransferase
VAANTKRFRDGMTSAGFQILGENHPICPVFLGDARLASAMAEQLLSNSILSF